ncbi:SCO family protein [Soonwooa sp.]|uniref:SCO family protein n=1 Tax=Soonwooa sp. TaxID=1938592 RepID=UPI0028AE6EAB|nr:SCO family protein [Soonwooa sp.]
MSASENIPTSKSKKIGIPVLVILLIAALVFGVRQYMNSSLFTVMKVPEFSLKNQHDITITNKDMLGKVYLVEFFFSRCPTICPVMNNNMRHIEEEINDPNFGIISISIDPENDTPEILKEHARKIGTRSSNWHFLTGDRNYIGDIAKKFDIYVGDQKDKAESLNHSGEIALVDKDGNIRCRFGKDGMPILYYSGLNYDDEAGTKTSLVGKYHPDREILIEDIRKLLK